VTAAPARREAATFASPGITDIYGLQPEDVAHDARSAYDRIPADEKGWFAEAQQAAVRDLKPLCFEHQVLHPTKGTIWAEFRAVPEKESDGSILWHGVEIDITGRKRLEGKLIQLNRAVEQSPASIIITDTAGNIQYVNPKFTEVTGYAKEEVLGKNPRVLKGGNMTPEHYRRLWDVITAGQKWRGEFLNRKKNGEMFWEFALITPILDKQGIITQYLAIKEDITVRKQLEEQLRQSQKMEVVGRLAGGVAHDFNNLLTAILGNVELLRDVDALKSNAEAAVELSEIAKAAERASDLTRQLLTFSRRQAFQSRLLDLNDVVRESSKMIRRLISENIGMETTFAPAGAPIQADRSMMEQILVNLAVNSRDAMPRGGKLAIQITPFIFTESELAGHPQARAGRFIRPTVADTGCGIAPEHLKHIFEPFFTTKDVGKGTGLGLATVHGIVEQHQGWIEVASALGVGTAFHVFLPRCQPEESSAATLNLPPAADTGGGTETILLVEDEAALRRLLRTVLERQKYRVLTAESGESALEIWREHRQEIQLLITDMIMPGGILGCALADRLLAEKPALKVIYCSGYNDDVLGEDSRLRSNPNFLEKPFESGKLLKLVRMNLDELAPPVRTS